MTHLHPTLVIRDATPADAGAIDGLFTQLKQVEGKDFATDIVAIMKAVFEGDPRMRLSALVAELEGRVIGTVFYYSGYDVLTASYGLHLSDFVIELAFRGQGVGRRLFAALAKQNLDAGGEWISLTVMKNNEAARGFYDRLGMIEVSVDFYAIGPRGLARVVATA